MRKPPSPPHWSYLEKAIYIKSLEENAINAVLELGYSKISTELNMMPYLAQKFHF